MSTTYVSIDISVNTNNFTFTLPVQNYKGDISWGDGSYNTYNFYESSMTHVYSPGTYTIQLINVTSLMIYGYRADIISLSQSSIINFNWYVALPYLEILTYAFIRCVNLKSFYIANPDFTQSVKEMNAMFYGCRSLNSPIQLNCANLNTLYLFAGGFEYGFFEGATSLNSSVTLTNTQNITNMSRLFYGCTSFNQPISLNCTSCSKLDEFLIGASSFNNNLNLTPITSLTTAISMLNYTSLSPINYSNLLILWGNQSTNPNVQFDASGLNYYSSAISSRDNLIQNGWIISDNGLTSAPAISSIYPTNIDVNQVTTYINIYGEYLNDNTYILIDGSNVPITYLSQQQVTILAPIKTRGTYSLVLYTLQGTVSDTITYVSSPTISYITPSVGSVDGEINVTIDGTDLNYNPSVTIGGTNSNIVYSTENELIIIAPTKPQGQYNLLLTTTYGSDTAQFSYVGSPIISSIQPPTVTANQTSSIVIYGTSFVSSTLVTVDGTNAGISTFTPTQINCVVPIRPPGTYNLVVSTDYGTADVSFTYINGVIPICFLAGSDVLTDDGYIAIEKLIPGKHTIRGKRILAITNTISHEKDITLIKKNAIHTNIPSKDTVISNDHKVLYFGNMVNAKHLVKMIDNVYKIQYNNELLYNVLLETHDKMVVNNLIVETLNPKNIYAKIITSTISESKKNVLINKISDCIVRNDIKNYETLCAKIQNKLKR